jgi:hypothetical protein
MGGPHIISMGVSHSGGWQRRRLGRRGIHPHRLIPTGHLLPISPPARLLPVLISFLLLLTSPPAQAGDLLPAPQGPVLLAVSGDIDRTTDGKVALFDRQMLESMGIITMAAISPLDDEPVQFQGVLLRRLLAVVGAHGTAVEAIALNDYVAEIPIAEAEHHDVVIALMRQGHDIPVREMGPLMILYPIEREPGLDTEAVAARSVRQLAQIVVRDGTAPWDGKSVAARSMSASNDGSSLAP